MWIKPDLARMLERWKHTWRISAVQRKRLLPLYFCPAKLFSSLTVVCQRLWEWTMCMGVSWLCVPEKLNTVCLIVPPLSSPSLLSWFAWVCSCVDLSFWRQDWGKWLKKPRKTFRINRDAKGKVVKMLITMLTAMYMVVRVVESVRKIEWWNRNKSRDGKVIIISRN